MATATMNISEPTTTELKIASPNGLVTRTVLRTPLRDALPSEIPLIDLAPMFSKDIESRKAIARQFHDAAVRSGFFYIKNHGIASSLSNEAYESCLSFFRQDSQTRKKAELKDSLHNGYHPAQTEAINPDEGVDVREGFSVLYDPAYDGKDPEQIPTEAKQYISSEDAHWEATKHLPRFEESLKEYLQACTRLARAMTRTFALSLNLPEDAFDDKITYPSASLLLNYYPPIPRDKSTAPTDPNAKVSIGSHTDFQLFTILWQDDVGGLQVLNKDGQWVNARPIPDTFVVNIADYFQRITNDKYLSTVHRAQNWSGMERVSIPFFWGFGLHDTCSVVDTCVGPGEQKKYKEIKCFDWVKKRLEDLSNLKKEEKLSR